MRVGGRAHLAAGAAEAKGVRWEAVRHVEATRSDSAFRSVKWEAWIIGHIGAFHLSRGQTTTGLRSHVGWSNLILKVTGSCRWASAAVT